ncbi:hypothetical protein QE152_g13773 [Popillia japonica]|uniref:Uncharacterized protein n=1 Tax=Popillia japonica TaxID=7064 RepID=A0AAW1LAR7_POPJA
MGTILPNPLRHKNKYSTKSRSTSIPFCPFFGGGGRQTYYVKKLLPASKTKDKLAYERHRRGGFAPRSQSKRMSGYGEEISRGASTVPCSMQRSNPIFVSDPDLKSKQIGIRWYADFHSTLPSSFIFSYMYVYGIGCVMFHYKEYSRSIKFCVRGLYGHIRIIPSGDEKVCVKALLLL